MSGCPQLILEQNIEFFIVMFKPESIATILRRFRYWWWNLTLLLSFHHSKKILLFIHPQRLNQSNLTSQSFSASLGQDKGLAQEGEA